jgi:hypothetical protein
VHAVVALALPAVEAFDLAIPAQVFGDRGQAGRYSFTVCAPAPGLVRSTTGYAVHARHGLEAPDAACACTWPATPGPRPPLTGPPTKAGSLRIRAVLPLAVGSRLVKHR